MEVNAQRRMAAKILKCGESRVWFDPARVGDISQAITSADIRRLISSNIIKERPKISPSLSRRRWLIAQKRKGRRKGHGSRKGAMETRAPRKRAWINRIRSQRKLLKELLGAGMIEKKQYKKLYAMAKGGFFRSRAHLRGYVEETGSKSLGVSVVKSGKKNQ